MKSNADVEVFVLVYNDGKIAAKAIESVLAQTYNNVRLTILENGSSDYDSRYIVKKYASDKVRVICNERNIRSGMATPYMLKSTAEWICILFADDYYAETRIAKMIEQAADSAAVFSNNNYVDEQGEPLDAPEYISTAKDISMHTADEHLRKFYIQGNSLHPCAMMIRSQVYRELGGFPTYLHRMGDMYLFTKLLANYTVKFISQPLQYITIWKDGRNESARNSSNPMPTALELCNFCDLYAMPPLLNKIEKIFSSDLDGVSLNTEAERLWYLGNITLRYSRTFKREFAFRCLYKAIQLDEPGISALIQSSCGASVGEYVGKLTEEHGLHQVPSEMPSFITSKEYAGKLMEERLPHQTSKLLSFITLREYARQFQWLVELVRRFKKLNNHFRKE